MFTKSNTAGPGILGCHTVKLIKHIWKFLGEKNISNESSRGTTRQEERDQQGLTR